MNALHNINQASIEFDFTSLEDAETFETRAAQWVIQRLLPEIERVFDEVCQEPHTLVIDTLTLDLGVFTRATFYEQAPVKLRQVLQEKLSAQLRQATQPDRAPRTTQPVLVSQVTTPDAHQTVVLSQQQQRWKLLWQFLRTGTLPWTAAGKQSLEALGLANLLSEHAAQLIHALNNTGQPEYVLRRVVEQFPVTGIAALFPLLAPTQQWEMMSLLLAHPKSHAGELTGQLTQAWYIRFTQLLSQHNLVPLRRDWEKIIHQFAPQLLKALYQRHTDSQLPGSLLHDLNEPERLLLIQVFTPQEYPFLAAVLTAPELWHIRNRPDPAAQALPPEGSTTLLPRSQIQQQLWLFTLHYLLIDRGSVFNRQNYMSGLIVRMANAQNQTTDALLASLISALNSTTLDSTLRAQLLDLLLTIQPMIASPAFLKTAVISQLAEIILPDAANNVTLPADSTLPVSDAPLRHLNELVIALCSGQENQLMQHWPDNPQAFAALLRWCGQLQYVRRHWSETYSRRTLLALVEVLEPVATGLIRLLVVEKRLFVSHRSATTTERADGISLWMFTFTFLIVERGGAFSQKSYLHYLIQQMAARRNLAYAELLAEMRNDLASAGDFSLNGVTMGSLLNDLALASAPQKFNQADEHAPAEFASSLSPSLISSLPVTQVADIEEIINTLHSASQIQWNSHIKQWRRNYGQQLSLIIRDRGQSPGVLKRWVTHFDDVALSTITTLINPYALQTVHSIINESQTISTAIRHASSPLNSTNTRNALWELTLHYLISRRGSEFNQYQYLLGITEQLSARYQIKTEVLIYEWLNLSESGFLWRQQLIDLVEHHKQPPVTAPQLLENIQSAASESVLSQQQTSLLQHYAAINAPAMASQLQAWNSAQLARLVRIMQPQLSARVFALLPLLLSIVRHFKLAPGWFYQLLLSRDCPATPELWLQRMLRQINKHAGSQDQAHRSQLQQLVLSSDAIAQHQAERQRWLSAISGEETLLEGLQQWFAGNAPAPEQALLSGLSPRDSAQQPVRQWLRRALANPRYLQLWIEELSPQTHQALLFPTLTSSCLALLALRHAFCQLFGSTKRGEQLFWQTLYRQHWLKGIALSSSQLLHSLLIELNQLWAVHAHPGKTPADSSIAGLITHLLPLVPSASLRQSLAHIARQSEPRMPAAWQPWMAQLNHQQPEIKRLIEAIDIPDNNVQKNTGVPMNKPQDDNVESSEPISVHNAGLVIASIYIPTLFQRLNLTDGNKFVDTQARNQAIFCLQWMTNHTASAPEYQLLLNKVLCGVAPSWPIPQQVPLPDGAETLIDSLLTTIIAHWKALRNTSIAGLQSTFIQREGLLIDTPEHWQLNIYPAAFDMLLDQLPWRYQTIKYPWMDKPLFVSWR